ncbi:MAG: cystathionine beta-lyase [Candidatus Krumholzibacteriia bacterium]|jgi:cystathionine beta-lyase
MPAKPSPDFNQPVERRNTGSLKWDKYANTDILPLWVADSDFQAPPEVAAVLRERANHGVFGYGGTPPGLVEVFLDTMHREFAWDVDPAWLVWLPSVVSGLSATCRSVGSVGDGVAVMTPVYPPFLSVPKNMNRTLKMIPLAGDNDVGWTYEKEELQRELADDVGLMLFCHPHNPVGRAWHETELLELAEACLANDVVMCSDEIHNQLILAMDRKHRPLAALAPEIAARTITLMAPSKAFNIAGLGCAVAIIPDQQLRRNFEQAMAGIVPYSNVLGQLAAEAAWRHGDSWLSAQISHLRKQRDLLAQNVNKIPNVTMANVEATYLAWLDLRQWERQDLATFLEAHGIGLSDGKMFGAPGYMRLNFGCTQPTLAEACRRLTAAASAAAK